MSIMSHNPGSRIRTQKGLVYPIARFDSSVSCTSFFIKVMKRNQVEGADATYAFLKLQNWDGAYASPGSGRNRKTKVTRRIIRPTAS